MTQRRTVGYVRGKCFPNTVVVPFCTGHPSFPFLEYTCEKLEAEQPRGDPEDQRYPLKVTKQKEKRNLAWGSVSDDTAKPLPRI